MSKLYYLYFVVSIIFFSGCLGASPQWKAVGIEDSKVEEAWLNKGINDPNNASTYIKCGISINEVLDWKNFNTPESACYWKNWAVSNEKDINYKTINILESFDTLSLQEESALKVYDILDNTQTSNFNMTKFIEAILKSNLTNEEIIYFKRNYLDSDYANIFINLEEWKRNGISLLQVVLDKDNCSKRFYKCYKNVVPNQVKDALKKYDLTFSEIVYALENKLKLSEVDKFKKYSKLNVESIKEYLSLFELNDSKFVYKNFDSQINNVYSKQRIHENLNSIKRIYKKYKFNIEDIFIIVDNKLKAKEFYQLKRKTNITNELLVTYLKYFKAKDAIEVFKYTNGTNDIKYLERILTTLSKSSSVKNAVEQIKRYDEIRRRVRYEMNHDLEKCEPSILNTSLESSVDRFKCRTGILGNGYEKCDIEISLNVESTCKKNFEANIDCDVTVGYRGRESYIESRKYESNSENIYSSYGYGNTTMYMTVNVGQIMEDTVSAKLKSGECRISDIYFY